MQEKTVRQPIDSMKKENGKDSQGQTSFIVSLFHPRGPNEPTWKYLPLVLALGFIARATVALSTDFVLHPDEIMQYLEPAHLLAFGNGVSYWEYFYGARSWLVPGVVAGVLKLFDLIGLGEPVWYVGGVKLFFCAVSLLVPAGMYFFTRRYFSENAARVALVSGAFWYELVAFAHKPMTEFVAVALLMVAFALCIRGNGERSSGRNEVLVTGLAVLAAAVRVHYAPLALVPLGVIFFRTRNKVRLALLAVAVLLVVGMFDAVTWNGALFHSYFTNLRYNLIWGEAVAGSTPPPYQFFSWIMIASGGLSVLCAAALLDLRRYWFLLASISLVLLPHSLQTHKEYRFVFAVTPLWLMIGSDIVVRITNRARQAQVTAGVAAVAFSIVSAAGILNALPHQDRIYRSYATGSSGISGVVRFIRDQDPVFSAYRYLARTPGVAAVWHIDRYYAALPAYYYLHREIPFYDDARGSANLKNLEAVFSSVTHIVSEDPRISLPGYSLEREFGSVRILRRNADKPQVREWENYNPIIVNKLVKSIIKRMDPDAPDAPANSGIRFAVRKTAEP